MFGTKNLPQEHTLAKVLPEELSSDEKRLIMEGSLGYCATHGNLYRKSSEEDIKTKGFSFGIPECPIKLIACKCNDPSCTNTPKLSDFEPCEEWQ